MCDPKTSISRLCQSGNNICLHDVTWAQSRSGISSWLMIHTEHRTCTVAHSLEYSLGPTEHGTTVSSLRDHVSGFPLHHPLEVYMHRSTATGACTFCFVYLLYFVFPSCSQTSIHFHNGTGSCIILKGLPITTVTGF